MRFDPAALVTASDVERAALALFGDPLRDRPALSQVAAVWSPGDGRNRVIEVGPRAPQSATDRFVLELARARADAILTTGANLRAEPRLQFDLTGPGSPALMRWRVDVHELGPPIALILTSGRDLDPEHPALKGPARVVLYVPREAVDPIRKSLTSFRWITVHGVDRTDAREAIAWLRAERAARCVSIEAGPRTAMPLLEHDVDQLLLSRYTGALDDDLIAGDFLDDTALADRFTRAAATPADADGWIFERWERRA